ncbi:protein SCO1/2 [Loktanella fryxellensis]|uniref:Protein SCO1/2 n=1 Tax=Loktanella fryxellensis TaxID=245187 RepID=A0A1H8E129_9RHOB|nr:SCO family protein [Loktanella fryxellensis]SEN12498.1 protein SCO1/2 [Loktanella fryxellensis]
MTRTTALLAGTALLALLGGTYALTMGRADATSCFTSTVAGADIGGPFTLVDGTEVTVTDADVITEPTLIYFGYSFCPDVCPIDNARNAQAVDLLAEDGYSATPVFVTVDPERDTPEVVGAYVQNFSDKMIGLSGSPEQVKAAADAYRVSYSRADADPDFYLVNHSVFTYLMMPETGFATFFRRDETPEQVAAQVACAIEAA